jgi:hypothetical protein
MVIAAVMAVTGAVMATTGAVMATTGAVVIGIIVVTGITDDIGAMA